MSVFDIFSKRARRERNAGQPDVYKYDDIPLRLRVQIVHIWNDGLGSIRDYSNNGAYNRWKVIRDIIVREKGLFELGRRGSYQDQCIDWFTNTSSTDDALDIIEVAFRAIEVFGADLNEYTRQSAEIVVTPEAAISELNVRFREHGVGYQFSSGILIRIDSEFVHAEVMKPALALLRGEPFDKANTEFLTAHQHYREQKHKDAIVAAQRAFESTLKAICTERGWKFQPGDRASELVKLVRAKNLFPEYLGNGFDTYVALLKTGLPDIRNNAGGHGEAPDAAPVPAYIAAYALHLTASNIVMLIEAFRTEN